MAVELKQQRYLKTQVPEDSTMWDHEREWWQTNKEMLMEDKRWHDSSACERVEWKRSVDKWNKTHAIKY